MQRLASVSLCFVAAGLSIYMAVNESWALSSLFLVGLTFAVQSYRVVGNDDSAMAERDY
jgi:hypothetical protein